jgi:gamma-glutamylcyclotransferase (GGCT)/AIG2-like uncharacterized protein YtfP
MLVFVYGSLKKGFYNHSLLKESTLVGPAVTAPEFTMYDLGSFPAITHEGTTSIKGEVYDVKERTLADLDRLEGHPFFYRRMEIDTPYGIAWIYIMPHKDFSDTDVIAGGEWP